MNCLIPIGKSPCTPRGVSTPAWRQLGREALFLWAIAATVPVLFPTCAIQLDFVPLFTASWSGQTPSQKHERPHSLQSLLKLWHRDLNLAHLATSTRLKELSACVKGTEFASVLRESRTSYIWVTLFLGVVQAHTHHWPFILPLACLQRQAVLVWVYNSNHACLTVPPPLPICILIWRVNNVISAQVAKPALICFLRTGVSSFSIESPPCYTVSPSVWSMDLTALE